MAKKNKYVDFVSDKDFLECVKWVCDAYPKDPEKIDMKTLQRNAIDTFKLVFDVFNGELSFEDWIKNERMRQSDKTINNRVGEFHQRLLGKVDGWEDLGRGHPLGIDLKNKDDTIFMELKNKHNTVKGEDLKNVFDKLKKASEEYKNAIIYYAYITPKKPGSGERVWKTSQREPHERIKEVWGFKVYEMVTGDKKALGKVWRALPLAIRDVIKSKHKLSKEDMKKLVELFKGTIKD